MNVRMNWRFHWTQFLVGFSYHSTIWRSSMEPRRWKTVVLHLGPFAMLWEWQVLA